MIVRHFDKGSFGFSTARGLYLSQTTCELELYQTTTANLKKLVAGRLACCYNRFIKFPILMAKSSNTKKKSAAYKLIHEPTGHHYVIRLGRTTYEKLLERSKQGKIRKYNPFTNQHEIYTLKKTSK